MKTTKFLLAGESWVSSSTHYKGWDFFSSTMYETGTEYLGKAFIGSEIEFIHMPSHIASKEFPSSIDALNEYDVIALSDIGANTLLLPPETWVGGQSFPNRLKLLAEWTRAGGGLLMCGGYYSFAGIYAAAKYYRSPLESVLPVDIYTFDDRVETPEGALPEVVDPNHALVAGMGEKWPALLGFNELTLKPSAHLIAKVDQHPLLASMQVEKGRSLIWASDIGPHWCPKGFAEWDGYAKLWQNAVTWLANK
ncbi:MAG: glutamine amidotransferase [Pelolinea sp.]|nr:glutamine amidotransferase [Pelolinea sp.]